MSTADRSRDLDDADTRNRRVTDHRLMEVEAELVRSRERWHKTAEMVQVQEGRVARLEWDMNSMKAEILATKEIVQALPTAQHVEDLVERLGMRIDHVADSMDPVRKALYWAVGIVVSSVLLAILTMVLRNPQGGL